jgi:hypothetical protein
MRRYRSLIKEKESIFDADKIREAEAVVSAWPEC